MRLALHEEARPHAKCRPCDCVDWAPEDPHQVAADLGGPFLEGPAVVLVASARPAPAGGSAGVGGAVAQNHNFDAGALRGAGGVAPAVGGPGVVAAAGLDAAAVVVAVVVAAVVGRDPPAVAGAAGPSEGEFLGAGDLEASARLRAAVTAGRRRWRRPRRPRS